MIWYVYWKHLHDTHGTHCSGITWASSQWKSLATQLFAPEGKHLGCTLLALSEGKPLVTRRFPSQRASNAERVSISWPHHAWTAHTVKPLMCLSWQYNYWSLRCSWSIACWHCSNYIFILNLTPGFNGLAKGNCKTRRQSFKFLDLVHLILEILW